MSKNNYQHQQKLAEKMADEITRQGGDPIAQAQVTALVAGKLAARAGLDAETYLVFVRELCQAVAHEAGLSPDSAYNSSSH